MGTIKTTLSEIEGIGFATSQTLLRKFKSVKNIRLAGLEELSTVIGKSKANIVYNYFRQEADEKSSADSDKSLS
jgi:excinuclease ABC subunit C